MSEANLSIGRLPAVFEKAASEACAQLGILGTAPWGTFGGQPTNISIFNLASVVLFTDHIVELGGFADSQAAMESARFPHISWWQTSIWLPVDFQPPKQPPIDLGGWPVFLGSCQGLLADLAEVQKLSDMSLGTIPDGYAQMRAHSKGWILPGFELNDDRAVIQWVWKGLHDGAELASRTGAALMLDAA
jgi:hypothetical protein